MRNPRRKLERRRRRLENKAERIEHELQFSSDFFVGEVKGPRVRERLHNELDAVEEELEAVEREIEALDRTEAASGELPAPHGP